jgi:hypothetical protein
MKCLLLAGSLTLCGCSSTWLGSLLPQAPDLTEQITGSMDAVFTADEQTLRGLKEKYDRCKHAAERRRLRDQILNLLVWRIQRHHDLVETDLYHADAGLGSLFDVGTLTLTTAATAVTAASTKTLLAAMGTVTAGTRVALEENVLRQKSREAIISSMKSIAARQLKLIYDKMDTLDDAKYPLERGLVDVVAFMNAGSIQSAVAELARLSAEEQSKNEERLAARQDAADIDGDGIRNSDDRDVDGDGVLNANDTDIDKDGALNAADPDVDGDGVANELDEDMDGDGEVNSADKFPRGVDPPQPPK